MPETYKEPDKIKKYMASLEANLEKATGKPLSHWVKVAKKCPHTKTRDRLNWLKNEHSLGMSRAGLVLWRAFGAGSMGEGDPSKLVDALFSKSFKDQRPIYDKVVQFAQKLGNGTVSPRKGYVALYRLKQYCAIKPSKKGLLVGLVLTKYPKTAGLIDVKNLGGGDRIKKALLISSAKDFGATEKQLLKAAYDEA